MTEARLPTPRRIARTPVIAQPSGFSALGDALSVAGTAGQQFENRRFAAEQQVEEIDHRIALDEQKRQDDALFMEKAAEWVQLEERMRQRAAELRQEGSYRDHPDRVRKAIETEFRAFDNGLAANERVRQRLALNIVQGAARIDAQEEGWARQEGFRVQGEALQATVTTLKNRLTGTPVENLGDEVALAEQQIGAMLAAGAYNEEQRAELLRKAMSQIIPGAIDGAFNAGNPEIVQQWADKGFLDGLDIDVGNVRDRVVAERRALDIVAERQQTEALEQARASVDAIEAKIKLGINPTQEEFDAAKAALAASGAPEAERISFGGLAIQMGLNRQYSEGRDPDGIAAAGAASALQAKVAAGTATEAEQVGAAHLKEVADARAKAAGAKRKELAAQGVQGQMAVLADLDRFPPEQRFLAANEAKDGLGYVAQLRPHARQFALAGREVRKARPDDFGTKDEVREAFSRNVGDFAGMLGGSYDGIMNLAWDLYAGGISTEGGKGWDAARFRQSVHVAFGANRRADGTAQGGLANFNGAVILPTYQNADEFERSVRGLTFSAAVYADGRPAVKGDVLDNYRPEYVRDSADGRPMYRMIDGSGRPLGLKGGGFYEFTAAPRAGAR